MLNDADRSHLSSISRDVHITDDDNGTSIYGCINSNTERRGKDVIAYEYADATKTTIIFEKSHEICVVPEKYKGNVKNQNIYRYKIADEVIEKLYEFSKIHQYDDRKDFKTAWNNWIEENEELVSYEKRRLLNLGYDGDVLDKMFKSARYYFRKKSTEKKQPKERRNYIGVDKSLLNSMDEHLKKSNDMKPELSFEEFCKENMECLKKEVSRLLEFGFEDSKEIQNKIKKTYKNRYFIINKK